jgi:hypothetical protein
VREIVDCAPYCRGNTRIPFRVIFGSRGAPIGSHASGSAADVPYDTGERQASRRTAPPCARCGVGLRGGQRRERRSPARRAGSSAQNDRRPHRGCTCDCAINLASAALLASGGAFCCGDCNIIVGTSAARLAGAACTGGAFAIIASAKGERRTSSSAAVKRPLVSELSRAFAPTPTRELRQGCRAGYVYSRNFNPIEYAFLAKAPAARRENEANPAALSAPGRPSRRSFIPARSMALTIIVT